MPTLARKGQVRGLGGIVAIPGRRFGAPQSSLAPTVASKPFRSPPLSCSNIGISGVTRDGTGAALGGVIVQAFKTTTDEFRGEVVSDGSGAFTIYPGLDGPFYLTAYKAGSPDVCGTTVNTLLPGS